MSRRHDAAPILGGKVAVALFVLILFAFVAESELTEVRSDDKAHERCVDSNDSMFKPTSDIASHSSSCEPR
jgi:hypothetical protein